MSKQPKRQKKKINWKRVTLVIVSLIAILGILVSAVGVYMINSMIADRPEVSIENFESPESSQIFDSEGNLIAEIGYQIRTNIEFEDLPASLVDAFVSIEDSRYFEHNGFDVSRFVKAMMENVQASLAAGALRFPQGGSTLTMQLIDNTYFMNEEVAGANDVAQKFQEIFMAMELESLTSKEHILEYYLNMINFGGTGNIRGVQEASEFYFGKDVTQLTLSESALLAGIVNAPSRYNPLTNLDYATERRNTVLDLMAYHGYITEQEAQLAASINIEDQLVDTASLNRGAGEGNPYQSYIDVVIQEVTELTGQDPTIVPMKIYTAMDPDVQDTMDQLQAGEIEDVQFPDDEMEMAAVSINNQNGQIVAIAGGRNYADGGSMLLNHATDQYNQPGSAVKPILSYALAFEYLGWSTSHVVLDRPFVYAGTSKVVKNFNGTYNGEMRLFDAVGTSMNTPALYTLEEIYYGVNDGRSKIVDHLQALGFSKVTDENFDIGYAIGGSTFQANAVELAASQGVFLNQGYYITPHTVTKIEFEDGTPPYTANYGEEYVISEETSYLVSELLYEDVYGPYYNYMQVLERDYPVYAKTGTTNWGTEASQFGIPVGNAKDKWMIFSTTQYSTAVWVGYEKADSENYWTSSKSKLNLPGEISSAILDSLHTEENIPEALERPAGVKSITHILGTFPYASFTEGMDPAYKTTGLINEDFYSLVAPETNVIEQIASFNATVSSTGEVAMNWAPYPDPSKLNVAEQTQDFGIQLGGTWIEAYGTKLFDWTWIYGPIRYRADIYVNNQIVHTTTSQFETALDVIQLTPGSTIKVCGFYVYEMSGNASNQICTPDIPVADNDVDITIPLVTATKEEIQEWANAYGFINITFTEIEDNLRYGANEIQFNGVIANGQTITLKQSEFPLQVIDVTLYIEEVTTTTESESTTAPSSSSSESTTTATESTVAPVTSGAVTP